MAGGRIFGKDSVDITTWMATSPVNPDRLMASMAWFMIEDDERDEARHLLACTLDASEIEDGFGGDVLVLRFDGPRRVLDLLCDTSSETYKAFLHAADALKPPEFDWVSIRAGVQVIDAAPAAWRKDLLAVLDGRAMDIQPAGFNAARNSDGLRFAA